MGKLTALQVKSAKVGRHVDGDGLMLVVKDSGARSWQLRIQQNGKRRDIGLGSGKLIGLAEARERAVEARKQVRAGIDPATARKAPQQLPAAIPTFTEAAREVHDERKSSWRNGKHCAQWLSSLEAYAYPAIGSLPVDQITAPAVRDLLVPIWTRKPETARRVLQRIVAVLDWAHAKGFRPAETPVRSIRHGLVRQRKSDGHFAALAYDQVPALMRELAKIDTVGRLALRFLILTAGRSGEIRGARWNEIDLCKKTWTIPASRMKARREHIVPLSPAAIKILEISAGLRKGGLGEPVFPGAGGKFLSDMTLLKVLRNALSGSWTVHGFRASFRIWAAECTDIPREIAEEALAHTITNKVEAAYRRTNYLDKRRVLMERWADHAMFHSP
ncbi:hypothetical protein CG471_22810 [Sphingobium sp. IP1]|uniref:tyrosine-type recombinase/integrase n=1 Tax=Sphingobium sp. IP1 TaxID=2021637 RepID=UPI000C083554|nr:integrase arm-type DNA-binding domain-containing protein [Sphingobium sp. IP1]PHP17450.1 hypothetical protein CG471_22810 [Sphingobium sp. IP1]